MSDNHLLTNNDHLIKQSGQDGKLLSGDGYSIGMGLGESRHYTMKNGKLLFNGGHPLAFSDTVSPVLNENSWETIRKVVKAGRLLDFWQLGDYKICRRTVKDIDPDTGMVAYYDEIEPIAYSLVGYSERNKTATFMPCSKIAGSVASLEVFACGQAYEGAPYYYDNEYNGTGTMERAAYSGSTFGDRCPRGTCATRYLEAEWADILELSIQDGDRIPAIKRRVGTHTTLWNTGNLWTGEYYREHPREKCVSNGIYYYYGYLHLPSAYELTGNNLFTEQKLFNLAYSTKDADGNYDFIQNASAPTSGDLEPLQIFQDKTALARYIDAPSAWAGYGQFITRTQFGTIPVGIIYSYKPYFIRASLSPQSDFSIGVSDEYERIDDVAVLQRYVGGGARYTFTI